MENYQRQESAAKLKKFYSVMSQALELYETEEGITPNDVKFDDRSGEYFEKWFKSTIGKHITTVKTERLPGKNVDEIRVIFNDGSGFAGYISSSQKAFFMYCTRYKENCTIGTYDGRTSFLFTLYQGKLYASMPEVQKYSREELLNLCKYGNWDDSNASTPKKRHACTALVQRDGWEFKKDYPWKASIK